MELIDDTQEFRKSHCKICPKCAYQHISEIEEYMRVLKTEDMDQWYSCWKSYKKFFIDESKIADKDGTCSLPTLYG